MRLRLLTVLFVASACGAPPVGAPHPTPRTTAAEPAPEPSPPRDDGRLPATVRPTRYFLELNVDPKEKTFAGRVRIGIDVLTPTTEVVLHAKGPKILTAAVSTPRDKLWARSTVRKAAHGKQEAEELVLSFSRPLEPGPAEIDLQYEAPFAPELGGLYRVESRGQAFAFTQFEPNDARRAFPCFDEPGFKVPFRISVTVPEGNLVVANTRELRRRETPSTGLVSYEFEPTAPLPTYLVAVAVGPFELLEGPRSPVPIRVVTLPGKSRLGKLALATAEETLGALADYFGIAYPYSKLDLVAVPEFSAGAMENAGLVTFREERVLLDEDKASLESRRGLLELMAHELAHQWFGNLVTMKWWDDIWLNEGFANWMGDHVVERARPAWGIGAERVQAKDWVMRLDMLDSARRVRQRVRGSSEALEAFDGITYVKGASAITQLESYLGPATFQRGIRDYVRAHAHKNASSSDLTDALARASGKDVAGVLGSFVDQTGVPLVEATTRCAKGHLDVKLSQREYRPFGRAPRERRWSIPVCLGAPELDGGELCTLLREPTATLERDVPRCPRRIFPNAGERGYYRYRLGETELLALARDASLTRAERVGLIGNAWALVRSGDLALERYFEALSLALALARDDHVLWELGDAALREVERALLPRPRPAAFTRRVAELVSPSAKRLGFEAQPGESEETRLTRKTVLLLAGDLADDAPVRNQARALVDRWLDGKGDVDRDLLAVALPLSARGGDRALFDRFLAKLEAAAEPEERTLAIAGIAAFDAPELLERVFGLVLSGTLKSSDLRYVFPPLFARPATAELTFRMILRRYGELEKKLPAFVLGRLPSVLSSLCDDALVDEGAAFFRPRAARVEGADKHLTQAVEAGKLCAALARGQAEASARMFGGKR